MSSDHLDVPSLVPARMVNEFVYCQRLFHLEWVQGQFEGNADTAKGTFVHRRVDHARGRVPAPDDDDPFEATSVTLSSDRLGLIAVVDLVEGDSASVRPVDYKKGRAPRHGPAWEPELIQLCVQGLLLRENGYDCEAGELYFAETRERRTVEFDEALVSKTLEYVEALRDVARVEAPPPPLIDSPKCPRCSLVGICLPDETNLLTSNVEVSPRRLVPRESAARPMYVAEHGVTIGWKSGRVEVTRKGELLTSARIIDISQVNVQSYAQVTTQLLHQCFRREIPVCWFTSGGWFRGIAEGLPGKNVDLRRRQMAIAHQAGLVSARRMVEGKIRNQRTLLRRNERTPHDSTFAQLKSIADQARVASSVESLLGYEGTAARLYFGNFGTMLRSDFGFDLAGRNRRPPRDPVNCALSYLYGLLVKDLTAVCTGVGFDPYVGVFHKPRFGRPALALDLAEEFRPLIGDSVVVGAINNGEIKPSSFLQRGSAFALTPAGRKVLTAAYERRLDTEVTHPTFKYRVTYRRVLEVQARVLASHMLGELPDYVPFMTR